MAEVRIRVGVSVDQSMRYAFRPLVQSAIDARRLILKEFGQVPKEIAALFGAAGRGQSQVYRGVVSEARAAAREQQRFAKETASAEVNAARLAAREQASESKRALNEMRRDHAAYDREQRRAARSQAIAAARDARELDRFATRTSHYSARFLTPHLPIASFAHRAASGIVHGFGVDPTFSGALERNIELESATTKISNKARLAGQDVSAGEVEARVKQVSDRYGLSRTQSTEALEAFVDKSGDLKMGMEVLDKVAERSIVMSSDMKDLASTMGAASNQLGNTTDKSKKLFGIIDTFGVQSDRGYAPMSAIAKQSPKLVPLAQMFGGDKEANMARLGMLTQLALIGGAGNAAQAGTSVVAFANIFQTPARLAQARKLGILRSGEKVGDVDPWELIKRSVVATGGDTEKLFGTVFKNVRAQSVIRKAANDYREAGGGERGYAAMEALSDKFLKNTGISTEEAKKGTDAYSKTTAAQVQSFQNAMDDVANEVRVQLLPVLKELQPTILTLVKAMGEIAVWAAQNPWKAVVAALALSIARAGIESVIRNALERAITGAGRGGVAGMPGEMGGNGNASKRLKAIRQTGDVLSTVPIVGAAWEAFSSQANDLAKKTGSKATLTDLIPGFRGGKYKGGDALMQDMLDVSILAPAMLLSKDTRQNWKRKFGVIGEQGNAAVNMDARMDSDARDRYLAEQSAAKTKGAEPKSDGDGFKRVIGRSGETVEQLRERVTSENGAKKEEAQQRALQEKTAISLEKIASAATQGALNVKVQNFPASSGEDPTAPAPDT